MVSLCRRVYVDIHVGVYVCVAFRVSDSVEKNRRQLQTVTDRIRLAQARVDKIKGSKKATKVIQHFHFERQCYILFLYHIIETCNQDN